MNLHDKSFIKELDLSDRIVYDYYREHRHKCVKGLNQYDLFKKAVDGIFCLISQMIVDSEGGVYIEGLGYFCNIKKEKKAKIMNRTLSRIQKAKKIDKYKPHFFPDKELEDWTMERMFSFRLTANIQRNNKPRKLHFDICESVRIAEEYARKKGNHRKGRGEFKFIPNI